MISATALNASTVSLNKSPQMPLGLDNGRLRASEFLVPSLPVSSRQINPRADPHNSHPHHHQHHANPHHLHYQQQQHQQHNPGGGGNNGGGDKRRERSILNGTAHLQPQENSRLVGMPVHALNGHRRSTSPLGGKGSSPNYPHMQSSPRKDAHSPMYAGEVPGFSGSPGGNYSSRSAVPIPCSSPSPGASASPKSTVSHSLSPNSNGGGGGSGSAFPSHFPPGLNPSANGASELSQLAVAAAAAAAASGGRLYPPGFPPPSAAAAHHAAFYAAAAAAAGHPLPYPGLFGSHFPPHQNPAAAASSYLDFHTKLLRNSAAAVASELHRSPSPSPPSRSYHQAVSPQQQQAPPQPPPHILQPLGSPQSTSVTSLHTKLIESVSAAGDRFHPHHTGHHNHIHSSGNSSQQHQQQQGANGHQRFSSSSSSSSSGSSGVSKGGPLGISGGIMGLSISPNSNSPHKGHAGPSATSATSEMGSKSLKLYMNHPGLPSNNSANQQERKMLAEMELINGNKNKESILSRQRMSNRSPEDYSARHHNIHSHYHPDQANQKIAKSISFAGDVHPGGLHRASNHPFMNGHASHHTLHSQHTQQGHHHISNSPSSGPTNLSTDCKRANGGSSSHTNVATSAQHHMFLPPSPKKRSAPWNFAVPQSPINSNMGGKMGDLLPPPPPPSDAMSDLNSPMMHLSPSKYLSHCQQNHKPSIGGPGSGTMSHIGGSGTGVASGTHYQSSNAQQLVVPSSPLSSSSSSSHGGSGPSTPKSPAVHFKFFGGSINNKENSGIGTAGMGNGRILNARNDSSSSTSSIELGVINGNGRSRPHNGPLPVEQMPLISAFRKGSMIKLASGDMKAVEDLKEDDFEKAAQMMADTVKIVYCHVLSIHASPVDNSLCKVTLALGAAHNQQVVVESSPEQPFFVRGRGWSSSSPQLTEKLLQLRCSALAVGDICITLTRHVRNQSVGGYSGGQQTRGPKSKAGGTRPYGTYAKSRNASTSSILKSSHQISRSNNIGTTRMNGRKLVTGPPTTLTTNLDVSSSQTSQNNNTATVSATAAVIGGTEKASMTSSSTGYQQPHHQALENEVQIKPQPNLTAVEKEKENVADNSSTSAAIISPGPQSSNAVSVTTTTVAESTGSNSITSSSCIPTVKRKSPSPPPKESEKSEGTKNNDDEDVANSSTSDGLRPPSPKKRRWSAPDQIEAESQVKNSSGVGSPSSNKSDIIATDSSSARSTPPKSTNETGDKGNKEEMNCSKNGSGTQENKESKEMKSNYSTNSQESKALPSPPPSSSSAASLSPNNTPKEKEKA